MKKKTKISYDEKVKQKKAEQYKKEMLMTKIGMAVAAVIGAACVLIVAYFAYQQVVKNTPKDDTADFNGFWYDSTGALCWVFKDGGTTEFYMLDESGEGYNFDSERQFIVNTSNKILSFATNDGTNEDYDYVFDDGKMKLTRGGTTVEFTKGEAPKIRFLDESPASEEET